jgi:hypothetical protein
MSSFQGKASFPQLFEGSALPIEVCGRVVGPNLMCLEKTVEFLAGFETEGLSELCFGHSTGPVLFERKGFEVTAGSPGALGKVAGHKEVEFHGRRLAREANRSSDEAHATCTACARALLSLILFSDFFDRRRGCLVSRLTAPGHPGACSLAGNTTEAKREPGYW